MNDQSSAVILDQNWRGALQTVRAAEVEPQSYFITWTCYGTWLHGNERGSVDREHNSWQTPPLEPDEERERREFELLKHAPVILGVEQRTIVYQAIIEVCQHRGWRLHAINVRTNHVHTVVTANRTGKRIRNDFKSYATRRMKEVNCLPEQCQKAIREAMSNSNRQVADSSRVHKFRIWTRGGSARPIDTENSFRRAIEYTLYEQGQDITLGQRK